jgi:hypothetical protein
MCAALQSQRSVPVDITTSPLTELVLDGMDPELVADLEQDEEWDIDCDPFDIVTCMRGSDLPLLLDACPTLQRLTLNSVLPRWCAELHPFLHDAQVRRTWCLWCLGGVSESVGGCECRGGEGETNPNVSCKKNCLMR